jgi:hypothetical protein
MNPYAKETPHQYTLRRYNETIEHLKAQRTELQGMQKQAVVDNTPGWTVAIKQTLKEIRVRLNRLYALRSNLRKEMNVPVS